MPLMGVYFWNLVSKIVFFSFWAPHSYPGTDGVKFGVEESTLFHPQSAQDCRPCGSKNLKIAP